MANPSLQIGNSNWAIKEDNLLGYSTAGTRFVPQPITMTRESAGTRVNSAGLVETVELLGSEEIENGSFTELPLGIYWGKYSPVNIVFEEGVAILNINSSNGNVGIYQEDVFTSGSIYKIVLSMKATASFDAEVLESVGAATVANIGDVSLTTSYQDFTFYYTATGNNDLFIHRKYGQTAGANQSIYIKDVSVKESTKNNLARVDYDGTASSLLVEPERTNLIQYSEDFSQWSDNQVTIEPNAIISPDGTLNASRMTPTTTSSVHLISTSGSTTMAMSVYAKSNGYHRFRFNSGSSGNGYASFDLNAGTVLNSGGTYYTSSSIDSVGNGWYRCTLVLTSGVASVPNLAIEDNSGNVSFIGDGTSAIYIWAGQAEVGSYATSYIPTDGGTVTRVQDQYSKTGISNLINSEEGVLFVELSALSDDGTDRQICLRDDTWTNRMFLRLDASSNQITFRYYIGGSLTVNLLNTLTDITIINKIACKWELNKFKLYVNGNKVAEDLSANVMGADLMNRIAFDDGLGTNVFYGKVKQLQIFKTALTDPELATLTT